MSNYFGESPQGNTYSSSSIPPKDSAKEEDVIDKFLNLTSYTPVQEEAPEFLINSSSLTSIGHQPLSSSFDNLQPSSDDKGNAFFDDVSATTMSGAHYSSNNATNNSFNVLGSTQDFLNMPPVDTPPEQSHIHFDDSLPNFNPSKVDTSAPFIQIDKAFSDYLTQQSETANFFNSTSRTSNTGFPGTNILPQRVSHFSADPNLLLQPQVGRQYAGPDSSTGSELSASNSPYLSAVESIAGDDYVEPKDDFESQLVSDNIRQLSLFAINTPNINLTEQNLKEQERISAAPSIVIENPEKVADSTPSLFSASSSKASSPNRSRSASAGNTPAIKVEDSSSTPAISINVEDAARSQAVDSSSYSTPDHERLYHSNYLQVDDAYLTPDDRTHNSMRMGRQRRHSESSSRSRSTSRSRYSDDSDYDSDASLSREKLSELAAPPSPNKKSQKNPASFACPVCDKKFTRPYNLKSHLRTHTNERPFLCTVCGKAFARQHDRKRHEELHSGEKKYQCRGTLADGFTIWGCGKRFARTDALRRHFQTESGKGCIRPLMQEIENDKKEERPLTNRVKKVTDSKLPMEVLDVSDYNSLLDQILTVQSKASTT
ncbi:hypothetical protein KL936_001002 [Ogataea polymorpha]|nr:hypothetical protein KL936_001002 [Ogataea polymorpha]